MIDVDTGSFFAIVLVAAIAATTVAIVPKVLRPRWWCSSDFERIEGAPPCSPP